MPDTIYREFLRIAKQYPDAIAVIDGDREVTYAQLAIAVETVARRLPARPSFIGVVMDHGLEMIAAILAVLKQGAAYVPAEPDAPVDRIDFMLSECMVDAVITQAAYMDRVGDRPTVVLEPRSLDEAISESSRTSNVGALTDFGDESGLAYVLYTSGTTGTPKGVAVEHRNVCSYIRAFRREFSPGAGDRMLQYSVCSFDIFVEEVFSTLLSGATLVITPSDIREDIDRLIQFIDERQVTIVDGFPYLMDAINAASHRPQGVRLYISGGDVLHGSQVSYLVNEAVVYNTYGPSETTCCVAYYRCTGSESLEQGVYPIGHPIMGTTIELVDANLQPVSPGKEGEILISGPGVSRGYVGDHPEQENFITGQDGIRRYRSGDIAYQRDDGALVFLHRKDDQVMIRGKRVEAKEVENILLEDEAVHQAVVRPAVDEAGFSYLIAYVVPMGSDFSLSALKQRLGRKLVSYMIPEFFVRMDAIPLNSHGKPDEDRLPVVLKAGDGR